MRQCSRPAVPDDAAVIDDLLELGGCSTALSGCKVCLPANIRRIEAGNIGNKRELPQLDGRRGSLQEVRAAAVVSFYSAPIVPESAAATAPASACPAGSVSQVLRQRLGSCRIARHGERKRGLDLDALTRGNKLQSLRRRLPRFGRIAVSGFPLSSNRLPRAPVSLLSVRMAESNGPLGQFPRLAR